MAFLFTKLVTLCRNTLAKPPVFRQVFAHSCSQYSLRSHMCAELGLQVVGQKVTLAGWVQTTRLDKFILLRDRSGICQITVPDPSLAQKLKKLYNESVIVVKGKLCKRPEGQDNPKMATGEVEVELTEILDISPANPTLPFQQSKHVEANEQLRLQYRYLDLRRPELQHNLALRSAITMKMREFLIDKGFLDIETPTLFRRTPGGAKEFVVPTQTKDKFYSLVQSPQQFKQLLMVGGLDRYFQIARCYRDEGGRPDRQPEFTQLDIEMSFANREDIQLLVEDLVKYFWPNKLKTPFETITYDDAINKYGVDKPDMRYENEILDLTSYFVNCGLDFVEKNITDDNFLIGGVFFHGTERKLLKALLKDVETSLADHINEWKQKEVPLIISPFSNVNGISNSVLKKCNESIKSAVNQHIGESKVGFLVCGHREAALPLLGRLRTSLAAALLPDLPERPDKFLWVLDFPLFLYEEGKLESAHHPFTAPHPEDYPRFHSDPLNCRSLHYDLVLNGQEVAGGSVRIHREQDQRFVLEQVLGEAPGQLEHLLAALGSGCPPHAGIAFGVDRLVTLLVNADSIRDVIAFPKTAAGKDLMSGAPAEIEEEQYRLYHLNKEHSL